MLSPNPSVAEIARVYLAHCSRRGNAHVQAYRIRILEDFARSYGAFTCGELKPFHAVVWTDQHPQWQSNWTIRRAFGTLKAAFNWAVKMGAIDRNPIGSISSPAGKRGQPMDEPYYLAMLKNTDALFRRFLLFLRETGARPAEASTLQWDWIDWEQGIAVLPLHKTFGKTGKPRVLYLTEKVVRLLRWIYRHGGSERSHVFINSWGTRWNRCNLSLRIQRLRRKAGVPDTVKLYHLRHAYATNAIRNGVDLAVVAELLGHAGIQMTTYYLHLARHPQELRKAAEKGAG